MNLEFDIIEMVKWLEEMFGQKDDLLLYRFIVVNLLTTVDHGKNRARRHPALARLCTCNI